MLVVGRVSTFYRLEDIRSDSSVGDCRNLRGNRILDLPCLSSRNCTQGDSRASCLSTAMGHYMGYLNSVLYSVWSFLDWRWVQILSRSDFVCVRARNLPNATSYLARCGLNWPDCVTQISTFKSRYLSRQSQVVIQSWRDFIAVVFGNAECCLCLLFWYIVSL